MTPRLAISILLLLAIAPAAQSQYEPPVVAEEQGNRMSAVEARDGRLCLRLEHTNGVAGVCEERVDVREPAVLSSRGVVAGAVVAAVARVEVEWPDGVTTVANLTSHPNFAGLRFFIASHASREAFLVRYRSGDGSLLATTQEGDGPRVATRRVLASGGGRGSRWSLRAWLERVLAPGPGQPDRTEVVTCVERRIARSTGTECMRREPALMEPIGGDIFATAGPGDRSRRLVIAALVGPSVAVVEVHLGDGRRVRARMHVIGGVDADARVATYVVPARAAVRRLVSRDRSGNELDQQVVVLAPATLDDSGHAALFSLRPPLPGTPEVAAGPVHDGQGVLRVREVGARLCAEVEGSNPREVPCGLVPVRADESLLVGGATERHGVVGGVVPPQVATVELRETTGPRPAVVRVTPQAPSPYAGAFAPHVRTFAAIVALVGPVEVRLLDASREELDSDRVDAVRHVDALPRQPRTRLRAGRVSLQTYPGDDECVFLRDTGAGLLHETCAFGGDALLVAHVACRPAATVIVLPLGRRRGLMLRSARGRHLLPRFVRLRRLPHAVFVLPAPDLPAFPPSPEPPIAEQPPVP